MASASEKLLEGKKTILILGDSITQMGDYVTYFDAWLVKKYPDRRFTVINAGVASETISGLSEDNHAGGRFPRPDLHERLERVLEKTKPDLIIACYGMNCGIYKELDDQRAARFQEGNVKLRAAAKKYNAEIVHMTPPIFDNHGKLGFDYDTVLSAYSAWMVKQRDNGWHVVDLHSDMRKKVDLAKASDPKFTVQKDTIHPDAAGHWMMAQPLIAFFGDTTSTQLASTNDLLDAARLAAVKQRMQLFQKAIHAETKPLRPGVPQGGTLESAAADAKKLEDIIYTIK
jgi:lysophospholipase L1-like esterase